MVQKGYWSALTLLAILGSGCATTRSYTVTHEQMTTAAIRTMAEEAHVKETDVRRIEKNESKSHVTYLEAPYIDYSKIEIRIESADRQPQIPELSVKITTDDHLFTRHKEWEERIHELVFLKLRKRAYDENISADTSPERSTPRSRDADGKDSTK